MQESCSKRPETGPRLGLSRPPWPSIVRLRRDKSPSIGELFTGREMSSQRTSKTGLSAGSADLVGWSLNPPDLLHVENKTRVPNVQEAAGAFNAKRAFLGREIAERLRVPRWRTETHVLVLAWTAEVLHTLRLRTETFR